MNGLKLHPMKRSRFRLITGISLLLFFSGVLFLLELMLGSVPIPGSEVLSILLGQGSDHHTWEVIVSQFRLPKAIVAILAGSSLSVAGLLMQTLFRNPLAGPDVMGLYAGASLGVAIVILWAGSSVSATIISNLNLFGSIGIALAASCGSAFVLLMILIASQRIRSNITILILGLMFGYATSSFISILMHFALAENIQAFMIWSFGSFGGLTWDQILILSVFCMAGLIIACLSTKQLNALLLGEQYAESMGLEFKKTRNILFIATAILAGTVTAFCGPIGFLGISVPHLCRALFSTANHQILIPACILVGILLALVSDLIASLPGSDITLPLNSVTSLIGAPVLIWVILSRNTKGMDTSI